MQKIKLNDIDHPNLPTEVPLAWKSDVAADMLRRLEIPFVALNPGASYRGQLFGQSNHANNHVPARDHVVAVAHGYTKATRRLAD